MVACEVLNVDAEVCGMIVESELKADVDEVSDTVCFKVDEEDKETDDKVAEELELLVVLKVSIVVVDGTTVAG